MRGIPPGRTKTGVENRHHQGAGVRFATSNEKAIADDRLLAEIDGAPNS